QLLAARLAPRARVDRDPRGRGGGGEHGGAAGAHKAAGLRDGRRAGWVCRRVPGDVHAGHQLDAVPVLVLDLRARHDHPRRPGERRVPLRGERIAMEATAVTEKALPGGPAPAILEAAGVSKIFGGLVAVDGVGFTIPERSIVSIIGPNGAGKTTFFNMLTGLYRPTFGTIAFERTDITRRRPDQIVAMGMAGTFQNTRLFATLS